MICLNFIHEENRIYLKNDEDHMTAEVTFPPVDDHLVCIDHTYVDPSLRGQGIAEKLMEEAVIKLRSENKKVKPTCSYAAKWFDKHKEYSDMLYRD